MIDDVLDIFLPTCPNSAYSKAQYVLGRLEKNHRIRHVGSLAENGMRRRKNVYCCRPIKNLQHEYCVTRACRAFGWPTCSRGSEVDRDILPDAEIFLGEFKYFLELDTGTMRRSQVEARWRAYESVEEPLLVVTLSEGRLSDLLRWSAFGYFTTLAKLTNAPWSEIWETPDGRLEAVEKPARSA